MIIRDTAIANAGSLYAKKSDIEALQTQSINSFQSGSYVVLSTDKGKIVKIETTSGAATITVDGNLGLNEGEKIDFVWIGPATSVTFVANGVTVHATPGLNLRARYSAASLVCLGYNNYVLVGDLSA